MQRPVTLVTGAAGNLGSRVARRLLANVGELRLTVHETLPPADVVDRRDVRIVRADLAKRETLGAALAGVDAVVHLAGVLFRPFPARFLPETNTGWFTNLVEAAVDAKVGRVILVSFPHVEGPTTPESPATGRLDLEPVSVHARTRLDEERLLFARTRGTSTSPVVLRAATVYGRGILMIEAARFLARWRLLGVWRQPTIYHLIQIEDFLDATVAAVLRENIAGVYHLGDDRPVTIQEFLDEATRIWGFRRPWRMPWSMIFTAATVCEIVAATFGTVSPLTRDFVRLGRVPHWGDTSRMREELLPELRYPTFEEGKVTLR